MNVFQVELFSEWWHATLKLNYYMLSNCITRQKNMNMASS